MLKRLLPALLALTALPAWATTQFYYTGAAVNTETAFDNVTGLLTDISFLGDAGLLPATTLLDAGPTGVDFSGFSNNNTSPANLILNGSGLQLSVRGTGASILIDVPTDVRAIGLHLTGTSTGTTVCFTAPGATDCPNSLLLDNTAVKFFGLISDLPIASFQLRANNGNSLMVITDFEVQTAAETPEPSTMALIGSGLILFPLLARRKRRR